MSTLDAGTCAAAYGALRARVTELVQSVDPADLDRIAAATPQWRVRDVIAHMVGVNTDILTGTLDGVASDAWTSAQVAKRRDWPVPRLLDEWQEAGAAIEANVALLGPAVGQWLNDACTHEHDIRHALGRPGARDCDAVELAFTWATLRLGELCDHRALPGFEFHTDGPTTVVGSGEGRSEVHASRFEIVRTMTGRRSRAQVESYGWVGPVRPEHLVLGIFTLRDSDLAE